MSDDLVQQQRAAMCARSSTPARLRMGDAGSLPASIPNSSSSKRPGIERWRSSSPRTARPSGAIAHGSSARQPPCPTRPAPRSSPAIRSAPLVSTACERNAARSPRAVARQLSLQVRRAAEVRLILPRQCWRLPSARRLMTSSRRSDWNGFLDEVVGTRAGWHPPPSQSLPWPEIMTTGTIRLFAPAVSPGSPIPSIRAALQPHIQDHQRWPPRAKRHDRRFGSRRQLPGLVAFVAQYTLDRACRISGSSSTIRISCAMRHLPHFGNRGCPPTLNQRPPDPCPGVGNDAAMARQFHNVATAPRPRPADRSSIRSARHGLP